MNFIITGHTSGIGKSLYNKFGGIGLSKSAGFNIETDNIIPYLEKADVFINNAFDDKNYSAQVKILYTAYEYWQHDPTKRIINIGSDIVNGTNEDRLSILRYKASKMFLQEACVELALKDGPKISLINPGYVDTPRVKKVDTLKINPDYIIQIVDIILESPYNITKINIKP